ncbi:unnamed protein product [Clavelina lepadiformis]|uniref:P-type domain-containing protein n=1 Tax=Clavelina lepadiformis TaxID=159417 RepID=A0ABP0FXM7_CLALP
MGVFLSSVIHHLRKVILRYELTYSYVIIAQRASARVPQSSEKSSILMFVRDSGPRNILSRRRPCARATSVTGEQACRAQGCCWDSRNYFSIFFRVSPCYQRTGLCPTYTCAVEPSQRESCGNWLQFACLRQGCCFSYRGRPNCYRRQDLPSSTLPLITTTTRPAVNLESSWSRWTFWSVCSNSCSSGTRFRTRVCVTQAGQVTPENCAGEGRETETCNSGLCQEWGNWTEEGICNAPCSRAGQIRISRHGLHFNNKIALVEVPSTEGALNRAERVRTPAVAIPTGRHGSHGPLALMEPAPPVSVPAVNAKDFFVRRTYMLVMYDRYRACVHFGVSVNVARCTSVRNNAQIRAEISETQQCFRHMCPTWTAWSGFLECSRTCVNPGELSVTVSRRQCARGRAERPANRREEAEFEACSRISQTCLSIPCTEAERFEVQTSAGIASTTSPQPPTTSTTPTTTTSRNVEVPRSTTAPPTPRTGTVSWGEWSDCSRSCGPGRSLRIRICHDANGTRTDNAQACRVTSAIQRRPCNTNLCEAWSQWVTSECRGNCVDPNERFGVRSRRRICNSNAQALGSSRCHDVITNCQNITACTGAVTATTTTTTKTTTTTTTTDAPTRPATAALTFTEWGEWTRCSRACGSGFRNRTRTCVPPRTCPTGTQVERCNALPCVETTLVATTTTTEEPTTSISSTSAPTTANSPSTATTIASTALSTEAQTSLLSTPRTASFSWGQWSSCSRTCGPGVSVRVLMCLDESGFIADSDDACDGNSAIERRACNTDLCDSWTEWAPSECIGSCLEPDERFGVQERKRSCNNPSPNMGI